MLTSRRRHASYLNVTLTKGAKLICRFSLQDFEKTDRGILDIMTDDMSKGIPTIAVLLGLAVIFGVIRVVKRIPRFFSWSPERWEHDE
jgi:hypothetical protein